MTSSVATVQFRPPVYGVECVANYTVKAVGVEELVMCSPAHIDHMRYMYTYTCHLPDHNGTGYNFTAVAITPGPNGTQYDVNKSIDCCE